MGYVLWYLCICKAMQISHGIGLLQKWNIMDQGRSQRASPFQEYLAIVPEKF